ncbi:hypothetical protein ACV350_33245, partial [Pseudomonas aeruginosa]
GVDDQPPGEGGAEHRHRHHQGEGLLGVDQVEQGRQGVPLNALLLSSVGIALATLLNLVYPEQSFTLMMAVSMFGALFTWLMIFFTHLCFRRHRARHGR